jgi:hypothetical protein
MNDSEKCVKNHQKLFMMGFFLTILIFPFALYGLMEFSNWITETAFHIIASR